MPTADSPIVTTTLSMDGVWLHDPLDPDGTARGFPHGRAGRSESLDVSGEGNIYSGRTYPVMDYGEHEVQTVAVRVDLFFGPRYVADLAALRAFVRARRDLFYRDGRGRAFPARISGLQLPDQPWGTQASFTVTRADG